MKRTKTSSALRLDAQLAYLDNRVKRTKQLNRQADALAALERANENYDEAKLRMEPEARLAVLRARVRQAERRVEAA